MKHKRTNPTLNKDYGADLYNVIVFMLLILGVLWYLGI